MKNLTLLLTLCAAAFTCQVQAADDKAEVGKCETMATEKKLAGAAKNSFVKKCMKDSAGGGAATAAASPACEKSAADKKLAGAAKNSHIKKCMADAAK